MCKKKGGGGICSSYMIICSFLQTIMADNVVIFINFLFILYIVIFGNGFYLDTFIFYPKINDIFLLFQYLNSYKFDDLT